MSDSSTISSWARALVAGIEAGQPYTAPWDGLTLDEGYLVQDEVRRLLEPRRGPLAGYKVAATARPLQEVLGVDHPLAGQVHAGQLRASGVELSASDFVTLALECEVMVRLDADVPASETPYTRQSIAPFVGEVIVSLEVIDTRAAVIPSLGASGLVADRCAGEGAVLGTTISDVAALDLVGLGDLPVALEWNGEIVDTGVTGNAMGHPLEGLAWLANHVNGRGDRLRSGQVVLTGAAWPPRPAVVGDRATYRIDGLGEVSASVIA